MFIVTQMKKIAIAALITSTVVLSACSQKTDTTLSIDPANMTPCIQAVQDYLDKADMQWQGTAVKATDAIVVDYIGRLEDGTVFDTSIKDVAVACGKYASGRNYDEGLAFTVGAGQMIAGFDKGVVDMKLGQTKSITIPAAEAYGERSEKNIYPIQKKDFPQSEGLTVGAKVQTSYGQVLTVSKIEWDTIYLDGNHELAVKDLIFDITIKKIN